MQVYFLRFVPVVLGLAVLLWFIPMIFSRATRADWVQTQGYYSPIRNEFILLEAGPGFFRYHDEGGNRLSLRAARMALPFIHASDVEKWKGFPLEVQGRTFSFAEAREVKHMRISPRNTVMPPASVHVLQESMPETSSYELPEDVLLLDRNGVRFVNCADGQENTAKGIEFTKAMKAAGVVFPLQVCAGNPSPYKDIDEGLILVDKSGHVFQLLLQKGQPVCRLLSRQQIAGARQVYVNESRNHPLIAMLAAEDGLYAIERSRGLRPLNVPYNPVYDAVTAVFTPVDTSIGVRPLGPKPMQTGTITALNPENQPLRNIQINSPASLVDRYHLQQKWLSLLCPISIIQFEPYLPYTNLMFRGPQYWGWAVVGAGMAFLLLLGIRRRQGYSLLSAMPELVLSILFGFPALILILIFGPLARRTGQPEVCTGTGAAAA